MRNGFKFLRTVSVCGMDAIAYAVSVCRMDAIACAVSVCRMEVSAQRGNMWTVSA
jgi:hypothetical protein